MIISKKEQDLLFKDLYMQKKLAFILNVTLLSGLANAIIAKDEIRKVVIMGSLAVLGTGGHYLQQMNDEYSRKNKKTDLKMRLTKAGLAAGSILAVDLLTGDKSSTSENIAKIAAATVAMAATTQPVADVLRPIPLIGGLLTDPVDENGDERKDIGAVARFALVYIPLRSLAVQYFGLPKPTRDLKSSKLFEESSNPLFDI